MSCNSKIFQENKVEVLAEKQTTNIKYTLSDPFV